DSFHGWGCCGVLLGPACDWVPPAPRVLLRVNLALRLCGTIGELGCCRRCGCLRLPWLPLLLTRCLKATEESLLRPRGLSFHCQFLLSWNFVKDCCGGNVVEKETSRHETTALPLVR
ncbi:unnamed protein product, partial [Ectocarpus fasciculatus]